jgi:hypothetical protein
MARKSLEIIGGLIAFVGAMVYLIFYSWLYLNGVDPYNPMDIGLILNIIAYVLLGMGIVGVAVAFFVDDITYTASLYHRVIGIVLLLGITLLWAFSSNMWAAVPSWTLHFAWAVTVTGSIIFIVGAYLGKTHEEIARIMSKF